MTAAGRFSLRLAIYGAALLYLAGDLFVFNGPLARRIEANRPDSPQAIAEAKARGVVAVVFGWPIHRAQLERAVHERLAARGLAAEQLSDDQRRLVRYAALGDLIDHQLLRIKVKVNHLDFPAEASEVEARFECFASRFPDRETMLDALEAAGISGEAGLRERLAARLQQELYVEARVAPLAAVSDEEIAVWHEANVERLAGTERIEARHVFLPTGEGAEERLGQALAELKKGADFAKMAAELSEDPLSREAGGALGWLTRDRLPPEIAAQWFALPVAEPRVLRSRNGWHLVEVTARETPQPRTLDETREEIRAAVAAAKRHQATRDFRKALREFESKNVIIYHDVLGG